MALLQSKLPPNKSALINTLETVTDYVFETPKTLKAGYWSLQIEKGDAWVFCEHDNFILREGESLSLKPDDGEIQIRRLYIKGRVKFCATSGN